MPFNSISNLEPIKPPVDPTINLTGYITPEQNTPLMNVEPLTKITASIPAPEEVIAPSGFFGWIRKLLGFGLNAEKTEPDSPFTRTQAEDFISQTAKMESNRSTSLEEEFQSLLTEAGLDRAYVMARINALQLQRKELIFDDEEMKKIWGLANELKAKIDESLKKQHESGEFSKIFGKIEMGSALTLLALTIVVAGITLATGGVGGMAGGAIAGAKFAAAVTSGVAQIAKATSDHKVNSAKADYKGATEARRQNNAKIETYTDRQNESSLRVADSWKAVRESEDKRKKVMEGVIKW